MLVTVHPHRCGEHEIGGQLLRGLHGSSPQVWGTPDKTDFNDWAIRFIPTGVGNTSCFFLLLAQLRGSSPQVWGTLTAGVAIVGIARFIPTGVGNTNTLANSC